jgi:hypothetical protein
VRPALLALLLCACAATPQPKPEIDADQAVTLIIRVLSDACTVRQTDDFLIGHTVFLLKACRGTIATCLHKVCVRLGEEDKEAEPSPSVRDGWLHVRDLPCCTLSGAP